MNNTKLLTAVLLLQGLLLAGQWLGTPTVAAPAHAQIPDGGSQRREMIDELRTLNGKMDKLIGLLESGKVEVRVAPAEENRRGR